MQKVLQPLKDAGCSGVAMTCTDGYQHHVFPILSAYMAEHPEQCLIACTKENCCPQCNISPDWHEENKFSAWLLQDLEKTKKYLSMEKKGQKTKEFEDEGLQAMFEPFWLDLPHANTFTCFTPDILHQLHNGVFVHLVTWCTELVGKAEIDARFQAMNEGVRLRHFKKGISGVSQWTGRERKEMEKVFVGLLSEVTEKCGDSRYPEMGAVKLQPSQPTAWQWCCPHNHSLTIASKLVATKRLQMYPKY